MSCPGVSENPLPRHFPPTCRASPNLYEPRRLSCWDHNVGLVQCLPALPPPRGLCWALAQPGCRAHPRCWSRGRPMLTRFLTYPHTLEPHRGHPHTHWLVAPCDVAPFDASPSVCGPELSAQKMRLREGLREPDIPTCNLGKARNLNLSLVGKGN